MKNINKYIDKVKNKLDIKIKFLEEAQKQLNNEIKKEFDKNDIKLKEIKKIFPSFNYEDEEIDIYSILNVENQCQHISNSEYCNSCSEDNFSLQMYINNGSILNLYKTKKSNFDYKLSNKYIHRNKVYLQSDADVSYDEAINYINNNEFKVKNLSLSYESVRLIDYIVYNISKMDKSINDKYKKLLKECSFENCNYYLNNNLINYIYPRCRMDISNVKFNSLILNLDIYTEKFNLSEIDLVITNVTNINDICNEFIDNCLLVISNYNSNKKGKYKFKYNFNYNTNNIDNLLAKKSFNKYYNKNKSCIIHDLLESFKRTGEYQIFEDLKNNLDDCKFKSDLNLYLLLN